jgi:hypothetical protein
MTDQAMNSAGFRTQAREYSHAFHIALDGNGINGLEGLAGVCLFRFDQETRRYAYKVRYFNGVSAGHAVSVNPSGTLGFLGNAGQHLLFYDARTLDEVARVSTLSFEPTSSTIQGSTHVVWLDDHRIMTCIGDHFYLFDVGDVSRPQKLGPHKLKLPHSMKLSASGRYVCYGGMDHPVRGAACEVGVWDMQQGTAERIALPTTCWHLITHPRDDRFYPISFRVHPQGGNDYHEWAMAFFKEYAFEVDAASRTVLRHWTAGREVPAHINSDICISDSELIFCNGASQTIVLIDLESFSTFRLVDEKPDLRGNLRGIRQIATQVFDVLARGDLVASSRHMFGAMRVSRFTLMDSVHACQLSRDQALLFTANRGMNHVTIYDYPSCELRLRVQMPPIQEFVEHIAHAADPRLGFHHGYLI